jgi:hypothetical protein
LLKLPIARQRFAQRVADAANRVDEAAVSSGLGLAPEVPDVHVERVRRRPEVIAPHALEDDRAREHLAWVPQEELEERELGAREVDEFPRTADLARSRIELQVTEAEDVSVVRLRLAAPDPPQERPQPSKQLGEREWLRQIVVRARVQAGDAAVDLRAGGEHQHRDAHPRRAEPAADLEPVRTGHENVEDDGVRRRREIEPLERLLAVLRELHAVPLELEGSAERVAHWTLVVDDQNVHREHCASSHASTAGVLATS